jgi:hypothetical protein
MYMIDRHPNKRWYGILGDDNFVHWPSLLAGFADVARANAALDGLALSETRCDLLGNDTSWKCPDGEFNR